jgi:hypothetical protein
MKTLPSIFIALLMIGCGISVSDQTIDTGIALGVSTGLRMAIKDEAKRATIANYIDVGAQSLRTVVGTPTPDELATLMTKWIPDNIKAEYPEVISFLVPTVLTVYQSAYEKYGKDSQKVRDLLARIATDLENGAANYITRGGSPRATVKD